MPLPAICLRPMNREDLHAYYRHFEQDPDVFMDMGQFEAYQYDAARVNALYDARSRQEDRRDFLLMLGDAPIGEVCLKHIDPANKTCELAIHLQSDAVKNRGYGSRAEFLALAYAFDELQMAVVKANAVLKNKRSQHVLAKLGFDQVGQDAVFIDYRLTREKFDQLRRK